MNEIENHMGHAINDLLNHGKPVAPKKNLWLGGSRDKIRDALAYGRDTNVFKSIPMIIAHKSQEYEDFSKIHLCN